MLPLKIKPDKNGTHSALQGTRSQSGFSLAEIMISISIIGILIVAVISQQKMSRKTAYAVNSDTEITNIVNRITSQIGEQAVCTRNFQNFPQNKTNYTQLVDANGVAILNVGASYGAKTAEIRLEGIETERRNDREMTLKLIFANKKRDLTQFFGKIYREIPINTILTAPAGNIDYCFASFELLIKTAIQSACSGNTSRYDATLNPPYGACVHTNTDITCPAGQFLKTVTNSVTNSIDYTCASLANACPAGQFIKTFNADGTITCDYALKACAAGQVIVKNAAGQHVCTTIDCTGVVPISAFGGFDSNGAAVCNQVTSLKNCGTDNFATQIDSNGTITCNTAVVLAGSCSPGQRIQGINGGGGITCTNFINIPAACNAGEAITGVDANGNISCQVMSRPLSCNGAGGTHHTYKECSDAGGSIHDRNGSNSMCIFGGATCPAGWTRCNLWGTQDNSLVCNDTSSTYYCNGNIQARMATPSSYSFANFANNSVNCINWYSTPLSSYSCYVGAVVATVTTSQLQVGCY